MHQVSLARVATISSLLLAGAIGGQARAGVNHSTDEPVTIAIAVGLGTGLAIALVYDQSTANFLSTAFGYAKPQPDADVGWYLGRGQAYADDYDPRANNRPQSRGEASAAVNWILPDSLDPKLRSYGAYHNVSRTFKNGSLRNAQSGGQPDPNDGVNRVNVDINGFSTNSGRMRISVTGGTGGAQDGPGSLNAVYKLGAEFNELSNLWIPWTPSMSGDLDPAVAGYYSASNGGAPSIASIAAAASASTTLDFSSMLASMLNGVTTVNGSQMSVGSVSLVFDLEGSPIDDVYSASANWWQSVQAEAAADAVIPTPGAVVLLTLAGMCAAYPRRR